MDNYFFKFLVLFVIVLTFLYVINNTKEFFSIQFGDCKLNTHTFINKSNNCILNKLESKPVNKKKIDVLYQYTVVKNTEIKSPNSHNIVFKNIVKDEDTFHLNGMNSLIYIWICFIFLLVQGHKGMFESPTIHWTESKETPKRVHCNPFQNIVCYIYRPRYQRNVIHL